MGDYVSQDGSIGYEIRGVVQNKFKSYEDSAKDIIEKIRAKSKKGAELPEVFLIELETVPYFMKNFRMKALDQKIDLRGIQFLNTSIDTI